MRAILFIQGAYYFFTGIWPLVNLSTFEAVTGPKTDDWLVQTVGVLAAVIGAAILVGVARRPPTRETLTLAILSIVGFVAVDLIFVSLGIIGRIYLVDAAIQGALLMGLAVSASIAARNVTS
jgi:hypothetical protein